MATAHVPTSTKAPDFPHCAATSQMTAHSVWLQPYTDRCSMDAAKLGSVIENIFVQLICTKLSIYLHFLEAGFANLCETYSEIPSPCAHFLMLVHQIQKGNCTYTLLWYHWYIGETWKWIRNSQHIYWTERVLKKENCILYKKNTVTGHCLLCIISGYGVIVWEYTKQGALECMQCTDQHTLCHYWCST